jgi:integrase
VGEQGEVRTKRGVGQLTDLRRVEERRIDANERAPADRRAQESALLVPARPPLRSSWDDVAGEKVPKSEAGVRKTLLPEVLRVILEEHLERTKRRDGALMFGRTAAEPFTPTHIRKQALEAWKAANEKRAEEELEPLVPIGLHELRHTFSTFLDHAGISGDRADRYMGHSNPSVQARYRHQLPGQLEEDARTLDKYLSGAVAGKVIPIATGAHTGAQKAATA